jgi:2-polyprenyl-3-methyl-5-hydroxy-6-metoxy-1,4-benzoquinol methylase
LNWPLRATELHRRSFWEFFDIRLGGLFLFSPVNDQNRRTSRDVTHLSVKDIPLTDQWNDFLLRACDPYAMAKYEILLDWVGSISGKKAVVVGSGSGEFAALLARAGASVTAIDIDEASIQLTLETARKFGVSVKAAVATLQSFAGTEQFELVVATDVIEHIEDDRAAARDLSYLVCRGGKILITVPALPFLFGYHDTVLGHYRRYTKKTLLELFDSHVRIQSARYYGISLIPAALVFSRWMRQPYPAGKVGSIKEKNALIGSVLSLLFSIEKKISPPMGTSLLLMGTRTGAE